jgi:sulfocyanin
MKRTIHGFAAASALVGLALAAACGRAQDGAGAATKSDRASTSRSMMAGRAQPDSAAAPSATAPSATTPPTTPPATPPAAPPKPQRQPRGAAGDTTSGRPQSPGADTAARAAARTPGPMKAATGGGAPVATDTGAADASKWLKYDAATNTVTFELIAGPFNFNGYTNGDAALVVPAKSNVVLNFVNEDGTPHSAEVYSGEGPLPNIGGDPAIPRAYTDKVAEGLPQGAKSVVRFTAPDSGTYRIICGVPGHALSGMWIYFKVDPNAKTPSFETKKT